MRPSLIVGEPRRDAAHADDRRREADADDGDDRGTEADHDHDHRRSPRRRPAPEPSPSGFVHPGVLSTGRSSTS